MMYQCMIDGRAYRPMRHEWEEAARDAVASGHAIYVDGGGIKCDDAVEVVRVSGATAYHRSLATHMAVAQQAAQYPQRERSGGKFPGYAALIVLVFIIWIAYRMIGS